jgi:hypothetical protein
MANDGLFQRKVTEAERVQGAGASVWRLQMECGHRMDRVSGSAQPPKYVKCTECFLQTVPEGKLKQESGGKFDIRATDIPDDW